MAPDAHTGKLRHTWAPDAMVVSFKLETDEVLLVPKSKAAISRYGVHAVIANELATRSERMLLITQSDVVPIVSHTGNISIDAVLVDAIIQLHGNFIGTA